MIEKRKKEHVDIVLQKGAQGHYNYWADVQLIHCALPEMSWGSLDLTTNFLGRPLRAPFIITAMTGGFPEAEKINAHLAQAAQELGIAFGVGSQRPVLLKRHLEKSYTVVRRYSPALVLANIGAPQLIPQEDRPGLPLEDVARLMKMVGAHGLAIHLNFTQELHQREGNLEARGCLAAIKRMADHFPVVAKETGSGISREVADALREARVKAIDVGGAGGTSFAAVESLRPGGNHIKKKSAQLFWDWGIPAPASVVEAQVGVPVIATGGIRSGLDAARAIALGAQVAGIAYPLLKPATRSSQAVVKVLEGFVEQLRSVMFLTGCQDLASLRSKGVVLTGPTGAWLAARGYKLEQWANRG